MKIFEQLPKVQQVNPTTWCCGHLTADQINKLTHAGMVSIPPPTGIDQLYCNRANAISLLVVTDPDAWIADHPRNGLVKLNGEAGVV